MKNLSSLFVGGVDRKLVKTKVYNIIAENTILFKDAVFSWSPETRFFLEIILVKIVEDRMVEIGYFIDLYMGKKMYIEHGNIHIIIDEDDKTIKKLQLFNSYNSNGDIKNWSEFRQRHIDKYGHEEVNQESLVNAMVKVVYDDFLNSDMNVQTKVILSELVSRRKK